MIEEVLTELLYSAQGDVVISKQTSGSEGNLGLHPRSEHLKVFV